MAILNKDTLFGRVVVKRVELSGGDAVHIRPLPASDVVGGGMKTEELIHRSLCDENGEPFFSGDDDAGRVLTLPINDFSALTKAVLELNGMKIAEGDSGEAEKN